MIFSYIALFARDWWWFYFYCAELSFLCALNVWSTFMNVPWLHILYFRVQSSIYTHKIYLIDYVYFSHPLDCPWTIVVWCVNSLNSAFHSISPCISCILSFIKWLLCYLVNRYSITSIYSLRIMTFKSVLLAILLNAFVSEFYLTRYWNYKPSLFLFPVTWGIFPIPLNPFISGVSLAYSIEFAFLCVAI